MIQPPAKKPSPKQDPTLKGMRIVMISLAVMMVGGGLMLFVYAFHKANRSFQQSEAVGCVEAIDLDMPGEIEVLQQVRDELQATLTLANGDTALVRFDACSGEKLGQVTLRRGPAAPQTP